MRRSYSYHYVIYRTTQEAYRGKGNITMDMHMANGYLHPAFGGRRFASRIMAKKTKPTIN